MNHNPKLNTWDNGRVEYWNSGFVFQFVKAMNLHHYSNIPCKLKQFWYQ